MFRTNNITLNNTATAQALSNPGAILNNPKSNIIFLNNTTQISIGNNMNVDFLHSTNMTVGATTGQFAVVVWDVTAGAGAFTLTPTPAANTTTEYILSGSFAAIGGHNYEFKIQLTGTGNISFSSGYLIFSSAVLML